MSRMRKTCLILGMSSTIAIGVAMWAWGARAATPTAAAQPVRHAASPVHPVRVAPVRVERTLVLTTEEVIERPVRGDRARVRARSDAPLMARAKRMLFGSGRFRPEPFPRTERQESPAR